MAVARRSELVLGGVRSGKSRYALARARESAASVTFIATAQPLDAGMRARIAAHRAERPGHWTTVEEPLDLVAACRACQRRDELVLVDCLTLWVSNRLLHGDSDARIVAEVDDLATFVTARSLSFLIVSNEVGEGVHPSTTLGIRFADVMGQVNQRIAAIADRVTLMVAGIPVVIKDAVIASATAAPRHAVQSP